MKHFYLTILVCSFLFFSTPTWSQDMIGGIINSYGAVTNITSGSNCSNTITLDNASGFSTGDFAWIIQMQGATIDESNSINFGDITSLNNAGVFEKIKITSVSGNQIITNADLLNNYDVSGTVQVVSLPQYADVTVVSNIVAMPWNGTKGGVIAFEASGTLSMQADIDASMSGFRGGTTSNPSSNCTAFAGITNYHYALGAWESEGKGEGVAAYIAGKEYGRGAQANGGGGGNDHNAGGGGGAGYAVGGKGGENLDPGFFNCHGNFPGVGGKSISFSDSRLFLGGGGGAGSENNDQATDGGIGGGIVYIAADIMIHNGFAIKANGEDNVLTLGLDGGGGGGGGGVVVVNVNNPVVNLGIETKGGKGSDTRNLNQDRCMGPGGGGGGGAIYTNASVNASLDGGISGIVTLSTVGCNGSTNNGQPGTAGTMFSTLPTIAYNPGANSGMESYTGCQGDGYEIMVNNVAYNENNPLGTEILVNQYGCDSVVSISLGYLTGGSITISPTVCEGDDFVYEGVAYNMEMPTGQEVFPSLINGCDSTVFISLNIISGGSSILNETLCWNENFVYNGTTYNNSMTSGQEVLENAAFNGCDSIVNVDLTFSPEMTVSEMINNDDVTISVTGGTAPFTYVWSNGLTGMTNTLTESGDYTVLVTDALGCEMSYTFFFVATSNEDIKMTYGLDIFPNPAMDILSITRTEIQENWMVKLMNINGQEMLVKEWSNDEILNMNVSHLPAGIYMIHISSETMNFTEKLVIRK